MVGGRMGCGCEGCCAEGGCEGCCPAGGCPGGFCCDGGVCCAGSCPLDRPDGALELCMANTPTANRSARGRTKVRIYLIESVSFGYAASLLRCRFTSRGGK